MDQAALVIAGLAAVGTLVLGLRQLQLQRRLATIEEERRGDEVARRKREEESADRADVDLRFEHNRGGTSYFVFVSIGPAVARNVTLEQHGGFDGAHVLSTPEVKVLHPGQEFRVPIALSKGSGPPFKVLLSRRDYHRAHGRDMIVS